MPGAHNGLLAIWSTKLAGEGEGGDGGEKQGKGKDRVDKLSNAQAQEI